MIKIFKRKLLFKGVNILKSNGFIIAYIALFLSIYNTFHIPSKYSNLDFNIISHEGGVIKLVVENSGTKSSFIENILVCLPSTYVIYDTESDNLNVVVNTRELGGFDILFDPIILNLYHSNISSSKYLINCLEPYNGRKGPKYISGDREVKPNSFTEINFGPLDYFKFRGTKNELNTAIGVSVQGLCGIVLKSDNQIKSKVLACDFRDNIETIDTLLSNHYPLLDDDYHNQDRTGVKEKFFNKPN